MVPMNPLGFRESLLVRVKQEAQKTGRKPEQLLAVLLMERFVARLQAVAPERTFVVKGGLALEIHLQHARTTRDIDLSASGDPTQLQTLLEQVAQWRPDPEDHMEFGVRPNPEHPTIGAEWIEQGWRFTIQCAIAGKQFGGPFGLDIAYADPLVDDPDVLEGSDLFLHYGIAQLKIPVYPIPELIAEKLHAYTMARPRINTRIKDLVDVALLAAEFKHDANKLRTAMERCFAHRNTHPLPANLVNPDESWREGYLKLRRDNPHLPWKNLDELLHAARLFLNPILADAAGTWNPTQRRWLS